MFGFTGYYFFCQVFEAFEKYYPSMIMRMYKTRAQFNRESYDIMDMFLKQRNFKVICFAMDKRFRKEIESEWQGISHSIKQRIDDNEERRDDEKEEAKKELEVRFRQQDLTHEMVKNMANQMDRMYQAMDANQGVCCCSRNN